VPSNAMSLPSSENDSIFAPYLYEGNYYLIMQFFDIPSDDLRQQLSNQGIELFSYIPNYAYLVKFPEEASFMQPGVRGLAGYDGAYKLSAALSSGNYPSHAYANGQLDLVLTPWPSVSPASLEAELTAQGYNPVDTLGGKLSLTVPESELMPLANHPGIQYVATPEPAPEKDGWIGRTSHRVNLLSSGPGLGFDGSGVEIAIGDDGSINHIDFQGRLTDLTQGNDFGTHGDMTAGLAVGAGNLNADYMGFAPAADLRLYFISGYPQITNAPQNYQDFGTIITSTSFGEGCGGRYTSTSQAIDRQVYDTPFLLHFFSAGNSAFASCSSVYGAYQYGNITGGRKAGKNVFAVANLFYDDTRVASSSRGPTEDGRIKPDISGHGQGSLTTGPDNSTMTGGGTSAASPSVAGTAAALVQAYRSYYQQDPTADLMKAILLNTAEDLGRIGPDYDFGWGRVQADRALEVIEEQQFIKSSVNQGASNNHSITVPPNTRELKVMLYWTDEEGAPVAAKALVNDLDLKGQGPGGQQHLPWKLSTAPHPDSLTLPAYRGQDHVNNMEQISITDPAAGAYNFTVSGHMLPSLSQDYALVYTFLKDEIKVVFPRGGDALVAGETAVVRWDAYGNSGNFILEYSTSSGAQWTTISSNVAGSRRHFDWNVPDIASADVRLRVRRGNKVSPVNGDFTILGVPSLDISTIPGNKVLLDWNAVPGADTYTVYRLQGKYMQPIHTTSATSYETTAPSGEESWYAIQAGIEGQGAGRRSEAKSHIFYACETFVEVVLNFDLYPGETSWEITDENGFVLASGSNYEDQAALSTISSVECLPYGCFDFTIYDSHNDGMCCDDGTGSYQVFDDSGNLLLSGGVFSAQETQPFCLDDTGEPDLSLSVVDQQDVSCFGFSNGSVSVSASGGSGDYTYTWSDGTTGPSRFSLAAGTYTVTATDGSAQASLSVDIVQPDPITVNLITQPPNCNDTNDGSIQTIVTEGAESQYTFSWSNGSTGPNISGLAPGSYTVTVTNTNGCSAQQAASLLAPAPVSAQAVPTAESCPGKADGGITLANLSGGDGNYAVNWSNGATGDSLFSLSPGTYEATITDGNGCTGSVSATVSPGQPLQLDFPAVTPTCPGGASGAVTAAASNGQAPYTYAWSNGSVAASVDGLEAGDYSVTATDANGCVAEKTVQIEESDPIGVDVAVDPADCGSNSFASAFASATGGTAPYVYTWSMGATTPSVFGLPPGAYGLTVTDAAGCVGTEQVVVEATDPIEISVGLQAPSCAGQNDGSLSAAPSNGQPPYQFNWNTGSTASSITGLTAGTYTVTVTDDNGCTAVRSVSLEAPETLILETASTDATCIGSQNGLASVSVSGGTGAYTYSWSNGATTANVSNLDPGAYIVTVTDSNGCSAEAVAEIKELSAMEAAITASPISCNGAQDGALQVAASGGSGVYTAYNWSNGAQGNPLNGLGAGGYTVTVTDELGCEATASISLQQPTALAGDVTTVPPASGQSNGSAVATASGGQPPYAFAWSTGEAGNSIDSLAAGAYSLTITDDNACSTVLDFQLEESEPEPCDARGSSTRYEWIDRVAIGGFVNQSGDNEGYGDFREDSSKIMVLQAGVSYDLELRPGFSGPAFNEHWRVWVDLNKDGVFSNGEEELLPPLSSPQAVSATVTLPDSVPEGTYDLRIAMKYGSPPEPCQNIAYGEVEAYRLSVVQAPAYCNSSAFSSNSEWIESVAFNDLFNVSGPDGGYGNYLGQMLTAAPGDTVSFELTPGFSAANLLETWQVFVDFNADGDFEDAGEDVYLKGNYPFANGGTFVIPDDVPEGLRAIRVIMSYGGVVPVCGSYTWGETEDYTLEIQAPPSDSAGSRLLLAERSQEEEDAKPENRDKPAARLYPNPSRGQAFVELELLQEAILELQLYSSTGALMRQQRYQLSRGMQRLPVATHDLPSGAYWLVLRTHEQQWRLPLQVVH